MGNICKICNEEVIVENHFWRAHKLKQMDYYIQYYPRYSKLTGELIKFRNKDFYLNNDFNDKIEMNTWLKTYPKEAKNYAIELLKKRKEAGKIIYAPSSVELASLMMPSMKWFVKNFHDYNRVCKNIGLKIRFTDLKNKKLKELINPVILCDTREQNVISFKNIKTKSATLKFGDYSLDANNHEGIVIEKKSLSDFATSFGKQVDRIEREIIRCQKKKEYLVILILCELNKALNFSHLPQMRWVQASEHFIFHNVRSLLQKYKNIQFLFISPEQTEKIVLDIFKLGKKVKKIDLQFLLKRGWI